jgi:hypothetical protein
MTADGNVLPQATAIEPPDGPYFPRCNPLYCLETNALLPFYGTDQ